MAVTGERVIPERLALASSPIQYVTENAFSIIRLGEVYASVIDTARECRFRVRNEHGRECDVTVHFDDELIAQIQNQRRTRLLETSVLWLICAEKCLATYLWRNDNFPDGGRLDIVELSVDELLLAIHWSDHRDD